MKLRTLLLSALCFSLAVTACGGRLRNNQPTQPAPAVATEAPAIQPTTAAEQPTTQPTEAPTVTPPPAPTTATESQNDPQGDELETQLQQLDDANSAADQELQELSTP